MLSSSLRRFAASTTAILPVLRQMSSVLEMNSIRVTAVSAANLHLQFSEPNRRRFSSKLLTPESAKHIDVIESLANETSIKRNAFNKGLEYLICKGANKREIIEFLKSDTELEQSRVSIISSEVLLNNIGFENIKGLSLAQMKNLLVPATKFLLASGFNDVERLIDESCGSREEYESFLIKKLYFYSESIKKNSGSEESLRAFYYFIKKQGKEPMQELYKIIQGVDQREKDMLIVYTGIKYMNDPTQDNKARMDAEIDSRISYNQRNQKKPSWVSRTEYLGADSKLQR